MTYQIFKAIDRDFIKGLFQKKSKTYFPDLEKKDLEKIDIERTSQSWAKETCLTRYQVSFGGKQKKILRGTAKKDQSKKNVWEIMNFLYKKGFDRGKLTIAKPIDFLKDINLLLYEEADGLPFAFIIENGDYSQIEKDLKRIAQWLVKLHSLKIQKIKFKKAIFLQSKGYLKIFKKAERFMPELKSDLKSLPDLTFIDNLWKKEKTLIHNDFYPGNIILKRNIVCGVDFDRACLGPPLMDVATLCGALEFPKEIWALSLSKKEVLSLQKGFFENYCKLRKIDPRENKKIFQAFLVKIFLDQVAYFSEFAIAGWNFMNEASKKDFVFKIRSLILKVKEKLKDYENLTSCV